MSLGRRLTLLAVVVVAVAVAACGSPPDREMQQAKDAIAAARAAGAEAYARDDLAAADDLLKRAGDAVSQRDYRLALNYALDSREQAQNATKLAADGKATAQAEANQALAALATSLAGVQSRLKAADASRVAARTLAGARKMAADGQHQLQEARTAMEQGDYATVVTIASAATRRLADAEHQLSTAVTPPAHRRR